MERWFQIGRWIPGEDLLTVYLKGKRYEYKITPNFKDAIEKALRKRDQAGAMEILKTNGELLSKPETTKKGDDTPSLFENIDIMLLELNINEQVTPECRKFIQNAKKFVEIASKISIEDAKAGKLEGLVYAPHRFDSEHVASFGKDHILVNTSFFDEDKEYRESLLWHEFGHAATWQAFSSKYNKETIEVLRPFRMRPNDAWKYYVELSASTRPDEIIADTYSDIMTSKKKPWENEEYEYVPLYKIVLRVAKEIGLPLPAWSSSVTF